MAEKLEDLITPFATMQNLSVFLTPRDWDWLATTSVEIREIATLYSSYSLLGNDPRHPWFVAEADLPELTSESSDSVAITEAD
jgi:hypothetical protein